MKNIYLLHGWSYTTEPWEAVLRLLAQVGLSVTVLPIPGLTDGSDRVWTLDDYVEWLKSVVDEKGRGVLIGHSNGGRISLAFAAKYPDLLDRLILIDSAGIRPRGVVIETKRLVFGFLAKMGKKLTNSPALRKMFYRVVREHDYERASPAMRQTMANLISEDLRHVLKRITAPTLIIWGARDTSTPLTDGAYMHEHIAGSRLVVIPDAKHSPHITHPERVAEEIIRELRT